MPDDDTSTEDDEPPEATPAGRAAVAAMMTRWCENRWPGTRWAAGNRGDEGAIPLFGPEDLPSARAPKTPKPD